MSIEDKLLLIRNYDLWANLTDEEYDELGVDHRFIQANKGDYVYFEAQHHNKLYFIKDGYIRIGYIDEEGREVIKEIIHKGEFFGQITLERNNLNGEFAQAYKSEVSLCAFTIEDFEKLLQKKPNLALKFSKRVGAKLRNIENRLVNLLNKDVRSRLIHFLLELVNQNQGEQTTQGYCIPNYLTHEDIAQLIGSRRQTVTSELNELEASGLLIYDRKNICFPDVKKLQSLALVI